MEEMNELSNDFVQLARLAIAEQTEDIRLYVARVIRKYRDKEPELAKQLETYLRTKPTRISGPLRKDFRHPGIIQPPPQDNESRLSLLKVYRDAPDRERPLLSSDLEETFTQLMQERRQAERLAALGLHPTRSAIFIGKPGVGKTLTARWLAAQLGVELYVLDLTAVMSSLLGRSGGNIRAALDYAKKRDCVLLLDEIDAIAKRRNDDTDIGELKRLVTVILQEVDEWPSTGLLLAATNHPELIDPALWRRFELLVEFKLPDHTLVKASISRFLGPNVRTFDRWIDVLTFAFNGYSFSDIEREMRRFRRSIALGTASEGELVEDLIRSRTFDLDKQRQIKLALLLTRTTNMSQHNISEITKVSRDTIRKYALSEHH